MSIRVCILEDDPKASETLRSYLLRYGSENDLEFSITAYENAVLLLEHYSPDYDIIYMDIQMPFLMVWTPHGSCAGWIRRCCLCL